MDDALAALAKAAGVLVQWTDAFGATQTVQPDTLRSVLSALGLPAASEGEIRHGRAALKARDLDQLPPLIGADVDRPIRVSRLKSRPARYVIQSEDGGKFEGDTAVGSDGRIVVPPVASWGYHRLILGEQATTLAVAPRRCFGLCDAPGAPRAWGLAAQLYSLRRAGDGGVGDYSALAALAQATGQAGGDALAVSPVHAMFSNDPGQYSPYAPSSRLFLNVLHIDALELCALAGVSPDAVAMRELQRCEAAALIDWPAVATIRLALMRRAFDAMVGRGLLQPNSAEGRAFNDFRREHGQALERHARFEALQAQRLRDDPTQLDWQTWPADWRDPDSDTVKTLANRLTGDVAFHAFLQWRASLALAKAQHAALGSGMRFGLIADLAVGTHPGGSHAWGHQSESLQGLSVGAPPDHFNPLGQDWGLATFSPHALSRAGYAPFIALLRAVLRHSGGIRIDHVLGLERLWLVPRGGTARDGAYVGYPLQDLLRLVALESWRHRALVIGEDLGTVPPGFRAILRRSGIMGTRVLWFERGEGGFTPPRKWPRAAMATSSTHDLPTVAGWWAGRDIEWRTQLALLGENETATGLQAAREADRVALWQALCAAGVATGDPPAPDDAAPVLSAVAAFLAISPCTLALLPLEDVLGLTEQPNLPGTVDSHPNWRRRLPFTVDQLLDAPGARARLEALAKPGRAS